jgi:7,8-dihydro-6-hydroxymethylpterin-pyrophosphokinase
MLERRFVLEPLAALAPDVEIPGNGTVSEALAGLQSAS